MRRRVLTCITAAIVAAIPLLGQSRRPLAIEDYYKVLTIANPQISPDGKTVRFSVQVRVESDNSTKTETFTVPADGSAPPTKVATADEGAGRAGQTGRGGRGNGVVRVTSPDGKWAARTQEKARPKADPKYASDFEKRHQERFKGAIFDWKDFQRDGAPFPVPNPAAAPALQIVVQPADAQGDAGAKTIVDLDLRPANLAWHPDGRLLAFTADPEFRDELKYDHPDLYTVTTDGTVTRLTNDAMVHGDVDFSPDGRFLSYVQSFGTDYIIRQKLNHGGPGSLHPSR